MSDLYHALLNHFKDYPAYDVKEVKSFILGLNDKGEPYKYFMVKVFRTLGDLKRDGLIIPNVDSGENTSGYYKFEDKDIEFFKTSIIPENKIRIFVSVTNEGKRYLDQIKRDKAQEKNNLRQAELFAEQTRILSIQTSLIEEQTKSIIKTNDFQRSFGAWSLRLTAISIVFIGLTLYQEYRDKTTQQMRGIKEQLEQINTTLKQLRPLPNEPSPAKFPFPFFD